MREGGGGRKGRDEENGKTAGERDGRREGVGV